MNERPHKKVDNIIMGIDYGKTNVGLAFGRQGLATPIGVVSNRNVFQAIKEISRVALENHVDKIVIGLPLTADGKETQQSQEVRRFVNLLKGHLKKPIEFINEFETSKDAVKAAIQSGMSQEARKSVDDISAALILKKYFDEHEHEEITA